MPLRLMFNKHMDGRMTTRSLSLSSKLILKYLWTPNNILLSFCIVKLTYTRSIGSLHELHKPNTQRGSSACLSVRTPIYSQTDFDYICCRKSTL
jgi:hypothetical protein